MATLKKPLESSDDNPAFPGAMEQRLLPVPREPADEMVVGAMVGFLFILPPSASIMLLKPHYQTEHSKAETGRR